MRGIRTAALLAGLATLLATGIAAPSGAAPQPAFGSSPSGCPSFFSATPNAPDLDPGQVGPFGTSQQQLKGIGLAADDQGLTVSLQVENMRRQAAPGHRWTYWEVFFDIEGGGDKQLEIYYDAVLDQFTWWAGRGNGTFDYKLAVTGTVVPGLGGGVAIAVPFTKLGMEPGIKLGDTLTNIRAESGDFISYIYMRPPDYLGGTYPSGIYAPQWTIEGPDSFLLMPCPGISIKARDLGNARGARVTGGVLPAEAGQALRIEQETATGWQEIAAGATGDLGGILIDALLPPGTVTVRARVTTRELGEVISGPVTVTLTD
jgi:hypothetical protein